MRKTPSADLRRNQRLRTQFAWCLALTFLLLAFRYPMTPQAAFSEVPPPIEFITLDHVPITVHPVKPPPPPPPMVPLPVANDMELPDDEIPFDVEWTETTTFPAGPPPPPPAVVGKEDEVEIFLIVEEPPTPIGGMAALGKRLTYPPLARRAVIEGTVWVEFVVDEAGRMVDPHVVKGIGGGCDEAALEALFEVRFFSGKATRTSGENPLQSTYPLSSPVR